MDYIKPFASYSVRDETQKLVNELFDRFSEIFTSLKPTFKTQARFDATKKQWLLGFMDAKITKIEQIQEGIKKTRLSGREFLPPIGLFIKWCQPTHEELGIPNLDRAYEQACKNSYNFQTEKEWDHKVVKEAWARTGAYELSHSPMSVTKPAFAKHFNLVIDELLAGKPIPELTAPKALEYCKIPVQTDKIAKEAIAGLYQLLK